MASFNSTPSIIFLLSILAATATIGALGSNVQKPNRGNMTHLHFYLHNTLSEPNATALNVVNVPGTPNLFGNIFAIDDPLTEGPSPTSKLVGRAQGNYIYSGLGQSALLVTVNLALTGGAYSGSTVAVLGRDDLTFDEAELSVVGGSGFFRMARGYVLVKYYSSDSDTGDSILELDVFVKQRQ